MKPAAIVTWPASTKNGPRPSQLPRALPPPRLQPSDITPAFDHFAGSEVADAPASIPEPSTSGLFFHTAAASTVPESAEFEVSSGPAESESEIDISDEWETQTSDEPKAAPLAAQPVAEHAESDPSQAETINETIEELRFYLAHAMAEQARVVYDKLAKLKPGAAQLAAVLQEIEAAEAQSSPKQAEAVEEVSVEEADEVPSAPEIESAYPAISKSAFESAFVSDAAPAAAEEFKLPIRPIVPEPRARSSGIRSGRACRRAG